MLSRDQTRARSLKFLERPKDVERNREDERGEGLHGDIFDEIEQSEFYAPEEFDV